MEHAAGFIAQLLAGQKQTRPFLTVASQAVAPIQRLLIAATYRDHWNRHNDFEAIDHGADFCWKREKAKGAIAKEGVEYCRWPRRKQTSGSGARNCNACLLGTINFLARLMKVGRRCFIV